MHSSLSPLGSNPAISDIHVADIRCSLMAVIVAACVSLALLSVVLWFLLQQGNGLCHPAAQMSRTRVLKLSTRWVGPEDGRTSPEVTAIQEGATP